MSKKITFNYQHALPFVNEHEVHYFSEHIRLAHKQLHSRQGPGHEYLGWIDLPVQYDKEEFERIQAAAANIKQQCDVFIVVGIGGSYIGSRAAIEMLCHSFYNELSPQKRKAPKIYFAGHNISSTYMTDLLEVIKDKEVCINVISKSGTTTEPAIAFRILYGVLQQKYGVEEARKRIYVTTDKQQGALKKLANENNYESFVIPDDVGGRYSVLTAVGLLPMAVAGIDIEQMMQGAAHAMDNYDCSNLEQNESYQYAAIRNALYRKGKVTEIMVNYEPCLHFVAEWWKQLYGESEGKDQKGIFPAAVNFSTDLHSMGQFIQEGNRNLFETILHVNEVPAHITLSSMFNNEDGLNFLHGKTMEFVNKKAYEGTLLAHTDGNVPNLIINIPEISPYAFGYLVYFFQKSCAMSGHLLGVNPFDQPGVESYKKNMFALLGKPGYEEQKKHLEARQKNDAARI